MQNAPPEKIPTKVFLYTRKRDESKTAAVTSLTNKNWARLLKLADTYNIRHEKRLTEDDILNMMVNRYYKHILKLFKTRDKNLK